MTVTITHIYDDYGSAESVVRELESAGFTQDQVSVIGRRPEAQEGMAKAPPPGPRSAPSRARAQGRLPRLA